MSANPNHEIKKDLIDHDDDIEILSDMTYENENRNNLCLLQMKGNCVFLQYAHLMTQSGDNCEFEPLNVCFECKF